MTAEQIDIIINSNIPNSSKTEILCNLINANINKLLSGGRLSEEQMKKLTKDLRMGRDPISIKGSKYYLDGDGYLTEESVLEANPEMRGLQVGKKGELPIKETIEIGDQEYHVAIARTEEEKSVGLSKIKTLPSNQGMLFIYDEPQDGLFYTMADTAVDLDIIFINSDNIVTSVHSVEAYTEEPVEDTIGDCKYVLEVNIHSGIKKGDELENEDGDDDIEEDDIKKFTNSKMLVLDEEGNVLMKLSGGERIFSRKSTKRILKLALKAYRDETDKDFIKLGRIVFKELDAQDGRQPEYVNSPK